MASTTDRPDEATLRTDPEQRLSYLEEAGVFAIDGDLVTTTAAFEDTRSIYADTYTDVSEDEFVRTVADCFGLGVEEARERIDTEDVTRHEVITYLSLQSFLERDHGQETLALLTSMAAEVGFGSAVPDGMTELTDETYEAAIEEESSLIVFVWKYPCDPCRRLKGELPDLLAGLPEDVAVAGVDGEAVTDLRAAYEVDTAPTVLLFAEGELVARQDGYGSLDRLAAEVADAYDVAIDLDD